MKERLKQWLIRVLYYWFGWRIITEPEFREIERSLHALNRYVAASGFLNSTGKHIKKKLRFRLGDLNRAVFAGVEQRYQEYRKQRRADGKSPAGYIPGNGVGLDRLEITD